MIPAMTSQPRWPAGAHGVTPRADSTGHPKCRGRSPGSSVRLDCDLNLQQPAASSTLGGQRDKARVSLSLVSKTPAHRNQSESGLRDRKAV